MDSASASSSAKPQQPAWIFLSHSGQQKGDFVIHLYHALRDANHRPFFDMDYAESLPVGRDYPPRIFQACLDCKIAVVVLSEDYVKSLWPMLELQYLLLPSRPDRLVYPLFYKLQPHDLSDPDKLKTWKECWEKNEKYWVSKMQQLQEHMSSTGSELRINLDIESWESNLSKLQLRSGSMRHVLHVFADDHKYIQAIVSNICVEFPPPKEYTLDDIIGQKRMQQEIDEVFQQEGSIGGDGVSAIGVHGIGGIGKSTLCKMMVNFYGNEFLGRCFYLEFPSDGGDVVKILLTAIGYTAEDVTDIDQAMGILKERLQSKKFFLAIDNIWVGYPDKTQSYEYAKRIVLMKFQPGTKIMLSSTGKGILASILPQRREGNIDNKMMESHPSVVHVPCLNEAEAVEALKYHYGHCAPEDCLLSLARSCFFEGQCHPLYLKHKGLELSQMDTRRSFNDQQRRKLISSLEVRGGASEKVVLRTVKKSFKAVSHHHRDIFIDLAATWPEWCLWRLGLPNFVRYHYDNCTEQDMDFDVLSKLEHHGLLNVEPDPNYREGTDSDRNKIVIHSLLKLVAKRRPARLHVNSVAKDAIIGEDL